MKRSEPILPPNGANPANQGRRVKQAMRGVDAILKSAQARLLLALEQIPVRVVNATRYEFQVDLDALRAIVAQIVEELRAAGEPVGQATAGAYAEGTAQASVNLSGLTDDYARPLSSLLASEPYMRRSALVRARVFEEMQGFAGETGADLARVLFTGMEEGRDPLDIARDIRAQFGVSKRRAEMIARTEINGALRRGRLDEERDAQERLGIKTGMLWASALKPTTRPSHARRHGRVYTIEEVRDFYSRDGNAINCYLPGTHVAGRFVAGSKARYEGPVVTLVTASGANLTVTPNHPVMSDAGMIAAAEVYVGQNLLRHLGLVPDFRGVGSLDGDLVYAKIEDVFCSLGDVGHSSFSGVSAVDFHGDARFMDEDVQIVYADRMLPVAVNSDIEKALDGLAFVKADPVPKFGGAQRFGFGGVNLSPPSGVRSGGMRRSLLGAIFRVSDELRLAHVSPLKAALCKFFGNAFPRNTMLGAQLKNACPGDVLGVDCRNIKAKSLVQGVDGVKVCGAEMPRNGSFRDANRLGDALDTLSGLVARDQVIDVVFGHFSGHVYDLQEVSGIMIAQGLITSNCFCAVTSVLLDDEGNPTSKRAIDRMAAKRKAYLKDQED